MTRVIVTRPAAQAGKWVAGLNAAGLQALALPLIEIVAMPQIAPIAAAWSSLEQYDAVLFVSVNAVEHFFAARQNGAWPDATRLCATGPGSVAALLRAGMAQERIDAPPAQAGQFDTEALWQVVRHSVGAGFRLLILRGSDATSDAPQGSGRDWFAQQVLACGGQVDFLAVYARRAPQLGINAQALLQVAAQDRSVWLFSSSEAVANLVRAASGQSWHQARAVATHPRIAQAAADAGFGQILVSRPQLADVIASIESLP